VSEPVVEGVGSLLVVSTPVGNLGDLSPRAVEALAAADLVACEDTRRTGRLLVHAGVEAHMVRVDDHTEDRTADGLVGRMLAGQRVVLVTDAGTPGIADPGALLIRSAIDADVKVEVVPGPSAVLAALVLSGLPTDRFVFEGFLPRKGSARRERLALLADERRTAVLYESPRRLAATIAEMAATFGGVRPVALARELTKLHEEVWRGDLSGAAAWVAEAEPRGEQVIVLGGAAEPEPATEDEVAAAVAEMMAAGASARDASSEVSTRLGVPRRKAYDAAIAQRAGDVSDGA
jgi:16S rRNA (cytidine1402-2'-O)-methyltransferase